MTSITPITIFDFQQDSNISDWNVVDDVVMGGRSSGSFTVNDQGHGVFKGKVSLENNGGFSSVRYSFPRKEIKSYQQCVIRLKGDGKRYQFRIKANSSDYFSYIAYFNTTGDWQTVEIPLQEMYPSFRGRKLDRANFDEHHLEELAFLIANKQPESFQLLIDKIELR